MKKLIYTALIFSLFSAQAYGLKQNHQTAPGAPTANCLSENKERSNSGCDKISYAASATKSNGAVPSICGPDTSRVDKKGSGSTGQIQ